MDGGNPLPIHLSPMLLPVQIQCMPCLITSGEAPHKLEVRSTPSRLPTQLRPIHYGKRGVLFQISGCPQEIGPHPLIPAIHAKLGDYRQIIASLQDKSTHMLDINPPKTIWFAATNTPTIYFRDIL